MVLSARVVLLVGGTCLILPICASSQTSASSASPSNWTAPRTAWGDPDLEGVWNNGTVTPLERPAEFAGKEFLTEEEAAQYEKQVVARQNADTRAGAGTEADVSRAYNEVWWEHGSQVVATRRTSIVTDPADGKVPALTAQGQQRVKRLAAARSKADDPDTYTDMTLRDRCIIYRSLPNLPTSNNNNFQIVQSPGYVAILQEEIHETRIIPLDGSPHIPSPVRQWLGDSRGHWEGDVLVIDTTNFTDETDFRGSGANLHLVERWRRVGPDRIDYEFSVEDGTTWTRPWSGAYTFRKNTGLLYEYACHEGNYAMKHILENARTAETQPK
jgi:hypothetical protein